MPKNAKNDLKMAKMAEIGHFAIFRAFLGKITVLRTVILGIFSLCAYYQAWSRSKSRPFRSKFRPTSMLENGTFASFDRF